MGIDRKRVEELKGRTPPAERDIVDTVSLSRACRACRTVGELVAMEPRVERFERKRLEKIDTRAHRLMKRLAEDPPTREEIEEELASTPARPLDKPSDRANRGEALAVARLQWAIKQARKLPPDTPLDEHLWAQLYRR